MTAYERILSEPRDLLRWPTAPDPDAQHLRHSLVNFSDRILIVGAYPYEVVCPFPSRLAAEKAKLEAKRVWWAFIDQWAEHDRRSV